MVSFYHCLIIDDYFDSKLRSRKVRDIEGLNQEVFYATVPAYPYKNLPVTFPSRLSTHAIQFTLLILSSSFRCHENVQLLALGLMG